MVLFVGTLKLFFKIKKKHKGDIFKGENAKKMKIWKTLQCSEIIFSFTVMLRVTVIYNKFSNILKTKSIFLLIFPKYNL